MPRFRLERPQFLCDRPYLKGSGRPVGVYWLIGLGCYGWSGAAPIQGSARPESRRRFTDPALETTAALIVRVRSGDTEARERLVARYLPLLQRWAHGRLPPNARGFLETSDLVQVTLVRTLDRLDGFESQREGAFLAYLRRALMNQLRNEIKRSARGPGATVPEDWPDDRASLLERMIDRSVIDAYESALEDLPETTREAIILSLEFGMTHREIADAIAAPSANAARMTVSRGLLKLARIMSERA